MSRRFRVGDRVREVATAATATVVEHISAGYVGIRYDEPQPTRFANGNPTTTLHRCTHEDLLELDGQESLL